MNGLDSLIGLNGSWQGPNQLWLPPAEMPYESQSMASITPMLGGKFVRIDYTWAFDGQPQEGLLLVGYEMKEDVITAVWVDSWHTSSKFMICQGVAEGDGQIVVRGSYAAPPGPDWGWRIVIGPGDGDTFRLVMYNIPPEGQEDLAVEANYTKAQ
jgi:hypothetical protein